MSAAEIEQWWGAVGVGTKFLTFTAAQEILVKSHSTTREQKYFYVADAQSVHLPLLMHTDEARLGMWELQSHCASRSIPGANPAPEGQKAAGLKCHTPRLLVLHPGLIRANLRAIYVHPRSCKAPYRSIDRKSVV